MSTNIICVRDNKNNYSFLKNLVISANVKIFLFLIFNFIIIGFSSCNENNDSVIIGEDNQNSENINEDYSIHDSLLKLSEFDVEYTEDGQSFTPYHAVRIGEYYWLDKNFYHYAPKTQWSGERGEEVNYPMSQERLDKYLLSARLDPADYQVDIDQFNYYYGLQYHWYTAYYFDQVGKIYILGLPQRGWGLPTVADAQQLIAMAHSYKDPYIDGHTVSYGLGVKLGQNPLAFDIQGKTWDDPYKTHWFTLSEQYGDSTNLNFKLMPAGRKLNADNDPWYNSVEDPHYGDKGDIYHLFYAAGFWLKDQQTVYLHDDVTFDAGSFHWNSIRFTRRLTDRELGYKLFKNDLKQDIIKLSLTEQIPEGYSELEPGYLRGYYVKYILNNANSPFTPRDLYERVKNQFGKK